MGRQQRGCRGDQVHGSAEDGFHIVQGIGEHHTPSVRQWQHRGPQPAVEGRSEYVPPEAPLGRGEPGERGDEIGEAPVTDAHAFGFTCRARGVDGVGERVRQAALRPYLGAVGHGQGCGVDHRQTVRQGRGGVRYQHRHTGVPDRAREPFGRVRGVQRYEDRARLPHGEQRRYQMPGPAQMDTHGLLGADPQVAQGGGQGVRPPVQLTEVEAAVRGLNRDTARILPCERGDRMRHVQIRVEVDGGAVAHRRVGRVPGQAEQGDFRLCHQCAQRGEVGGCQTFHRRRVEKVGVVHHLTVQPVTVGSQCEDQVVAARPAGHLEVLQFQTRQWAYLTGGVVQ